MTSKNSDITDEIGVLFWKTGNLWKTRATQALEKCQLTFVQFLVLNQLDILKQQYRLVTQIMLASTLNINTMVISQIIRLLKKKGLVKIKEHPKDTRAKTVDFLPSGKKQLKKARQIMSQSEQQFFQPVLKKTKTLSDLIRAVLNHRFIEN